MLIAKVPSTSRGTAFFLVVILLSSYTATYAQLPPEIMADAYLLQVEQAIRDGDVDRGRTVIDKIRTLRNQHELDLEDELYFRYARAADALGMSDLALESVVMYLAAAGREGQYYDEALALMNTAKAGSSGGDVSAQLSPDILADARLSDAEQAIQDGDVDRARTAIKDIRNVQDQHELDLLDAFHFRYAKAANTVDLPAHALRSVMKYLAVSGREGQHYVEALELMNRAQVAVSCRGWDSEEYFKTATVKEVTTCLDTGINATTRDESGVTPLHRAAKYSENSDVLKAVLNNNVDVAAKDDDERTPLHWAIEDDNAVAVKALIEAGADPNVQDNDSQTPLLDAAMNTENPEVIEALIDAGADMEARDNEECTPLHLAAKFNNMVAIAALIKAGADLEVQSRFGITPLYFAVEEGHPGAIRVLLKAGADRARAREKWTTLHWAVAYYEAPGAIKALLNGRANIRAKDKRKRRPIHIAARDNDNPDVVKVLIDAGADANAKQVSGWTPLHAAARYNDNPDVVKVLIDAGADANAKQVDDWTPLYVAARYNDNPDVVRELLDGGADLEAQAKDRWTPLHAAARYNDNPDVVKVLIDAGADANAKQVDDWTPLYVAARYNDNPDVVRELLDGGADLEAQAKDRWTPLHIAASNNDNPDVVRVLINAGANLHARNDDGDTPLDKAEQGDNYAAARLLSSAGAVRTVKSQSTPKKKGTDWGKVAVGVLGAAAIAHAGKDAPQEVVDQALTDWVNVLSDKEPTTNAPVTSGASPSQTQGAPAQDRMQQALQNLESVCGEKYRSGFAANDHYRFYCMAAFNDYCALKRTQTEDARTKLRASLAQNCGVLQGIGAASKCSFCQ